MSEVNEPDNAQVNTESPQGIDSEKLKRILGSCSVNFLFGAGVNGKAFPQFNGFVDTKTALKRHGQPGKSIEIELREINEVARNEIIDVYCTEFSGFTQELDYDSESIRNLGSLLFRISRIVSKAENRHPESKRINIFTLNYDQIVETILNTQGQFSYTLNVQESKSNLPFEIVGYNTARREYVPTFAIYKMHGSVDAVGRLSKESIVFPGEDKLGNVLSDFYETLFAMKSELLRKNSVLFVVGYSWNDDHINGVVRDAIDNGLTVYQLQFNENSALPSGMSERIEVVPPVQVEPRQDTTLTLANIFKRVCGL